MSVVVQSELTGIPVKRGKVRDVYDLGDRILLVATDRISAFDWVLPTGIPRKGEVLTRMSERWFDQLDVNHHFPPEDVVERTTERYIEAYETLTGQLFQEPRLHRRE